MKPRIKLAETKTEDGATIALYEHDKAFSMSVNGQELMHSKASASEELLGKIGVARLNRSETARVMVGGLGLGFTLRAALEGSGPKTTVEIVELLPEMIEWYRSHLEPLNGPLLQDPRVEIVSRDITSLIRKSAPETYDAIMLDVDNGPVPIVSSNNASLYSHSGIRLIRAALKPTGRVVYWSAGPEPKFEVRLRKAGFDVTALPAKVHAGARRAAYLLYIADKS